MFRCIREARVEPEVAVGLNACKMRCVEHTSLRDPDHVHTPVLGIRIMCTHQS